jgi:signal transduction histidine kinase
VGQIYFGVDEVKWVKIQPALTPENATWVVGDRERYQQMVSNLLSNAIKFTRAGQISVSVGALETSPSNEEGFWRCVVKDSGIGVPADDINKLFQPFSQASQHGFSATKGTGLGLAIVAGLAKQMGGTTGVQSIDGQGSSFWFTVKLPRQK